MNDTPILAESTDSGKVKGRDFLRIKRERGGGCVLRTWLSDKPVAVNVGQSCDALRACILGTFSHTTCFPISCALRACFLDKPVAVNVGRASAPSGLDLRDVFAYGLFPNQLRPSGLLLGQVSKGLKRLASALNILGDSYGIRTHEPAVRGRCLNHLTKEPLNMDYYITYFAVWQDFF